MSGAEPHTGTRGASMGTRRACVLAGLSAGTGAVCAACLPLRGTKEGSAPQRRPITLRFWGGPYAAQRADQVAQWNSAHSGVRVEFESVPDVGQGTAALRRLVAVMAAKNGPDLLDFDRFQIASFANWRALRPLDDLARREQVPLERFLPATIEEATGVDGKLYGLPSSVDTRLLLWNKEAFANARLDPARPPETWEQLRQVAVQLTQRAGATPLQDGRLGFHVEEGQSLLHLLAWQNGGAFQSSDGRRATLGRTENVEALGWLAELVEAQGGWPAARALRDRWSGHADDAQHPFLTGQLAMLFQIPDWLGGSVGRHRPDLAFGAAAPPVRREGQPPMSWSGGYGYVLGRETAAPAAAWSVMAWLVSEEAVRGAFNGERLRAGAAGGIYLPGSVAQPALDAALRREFRTGVAALDATLETAAVVLPQSRIRERSLAAAEVWDGIAAAQARAVSGQLPPDRALDEQNQVVQRALDQAWALVGPQPRPSG